MKPPFGDRPIQKPGKYSDAYYMCTSKYNVCPPVYVINKNLNLDFKHPRSNEPAKSHYIQLHSSLKTHVNSLIEQ